MNKQDYLKAITYMGTLFNKEISKDVVETWYEFCMDIPKETFKNAVKELAKEKKYLPSLQELLEKCAQVNCTGLSKGKYKYGYIEYTFDLWNNSEVRIKNHGNAFVV